MKVVINSCFGGFGLSEKAYEFLGLEWNSFDHDYFYDRSNPKLVECVEKLGSAANGTYAQLEIVEIPDDIGDEWFVEDYDGMEHVSENHRTWGL